MNFDSFRNLNSGGHSEYYNGSQMDKIDRIQRQYSENHRDRISLHKGDVCTFYKDRKTEDTRIAIVVSDDKFNDDDYIMVCYLCRDPREYLKSHVKIITNTGKPYETESYVICEQIHTIPKNSFKEYVNSVTPEELKNIDNGLSIGLGIKQQESPDISEIIKSPVVIDTVEQKDITNNPEYIKVVAERDVYKDLYTKLIKTKV